ncbi:aspartic peptidase domain-containing protein [Flagelloscypha sp. PMI_526]|nr:aspartic peptidase domain-containing protein [Flagelloscypha sp. PMI_526]
MSRFLAVCLVLIWAPLAVQSWHLFNRADPLPALQMLTIPLSFHSDGSRYSVDVTMSPNSSQPQHFKFALSTSTGYTYVSGPSCVTCGGATEWYNQGISNSVQQGPSQEIQNVTVLDQQVKGKMIKEDCVLKTKGGTSAGWSYPNQTVVVANSSTFSNTSGIDGLIGLGTNFGGSFLDTPPGQWLRKNPQRTNFTYGMQLNIPSGNDTIMDGGLLHWFTPDSNAYQGDPVYQKIQPRTVPAAATTVASGSVSSGDNHTLNTDWVITLDSFSFVGSAGSFSQSQGTSNMKAILDPYYPDIYFPQIYSKIIYAGIPGVSVRSAGSATNQYTVACDQKMSLSVTFGRFTISLTEAHLIKKQSDGTCVGTIQEWSDQGVPEFLFGSAFISNVYLIFVITEQESSIGFAARSTPSSSSSGGLSKGAIAGIAVGSAVAAGLIVGVISYFLLRRKRLVRPVQQKSTSPSFDVDGSQEITIKQNTSIDPYPITPPLTSSRPLLSSQSDSRTSPSNSPPATPQSPEWRHLSYATYQAGASSTAPSGSSQQIAPAGRLETIPDSPPPYLHSGAPWLQPVPSSPRRQKEMEAGQHATSEDIQEQTIA